MDFEQWRKRGVFFASDAQGITNFLTNYYLGFNLDQVLEDLEQVAAGRGWVWDSVRVEVTVSGNLHIQHIHDTGDFDEEPLTLRQILKKPTGNGRRASHEEIILPKSMQRQGLSRVLLRPYYDQYKNCKVDFIDVDAGDKGGGYAWARYGFDAVNKTDVFFILERARSLDIDPEDVDILEEGASRFYEANPSDTPFRIWKWSQTSFGEKLLAGTYWKGVLNLHDSEQVAIFAAYLNAKV